MNWSDEDEFHPSAVSHISEYKPGKSANYVTFKEQMMDGSTGDTWGCGGFSHSAVSCELQAALPVKKPQSIRDHRQLWQKSSGTTLPRRGLQLWLVVVQCANQAGCQSEVQGRHSNELDPFKGPALGLSVLDEWRNAAGHCVS